MKKLFVFLFTIQFAIALTHDEIKHIADQKHDRSDLVKELKIYPDAREYIATAKINVPKGVQDNNETVVKEKIVQGRYIVSEFKVGDVDMIMIVEFDSSAGVYRKWFANSKSKEIQEFIGTAMDRSITWNRIDKYQPSDLVTLMMETHTDTKTRWVESYYKEGKLNFSMIGEALKTK